MLCAFINCFFVCCFSMYFFYITKVWDALKDFLNTMNVPDPHMIGVFIEKPRGITIAGERVAVANLTKEIQTFISGLEEQLEQDKQQVTKMVPLRQYELTLMRACRLDQQLKKKGGDIQVDNENRQIIVQVCLDELYYWCL